MYHLCRKHHSGKTFSPVELHEEELHDPLGSKNQVMELVDGSANESEAHGPNLHSHHSKESSWFM